jgi:GTPase SAR1 family protein
MKKIKVTMLGPSGVGKTSLLAAIYEQYRSTINGTELQIMPDHGSEARLIKRLNELKNLETAKFETSGWCRPSTEHHSYSFELCQRGARAFVELQFQDFPGEWITHAGHKVNVEGFLRESDAVIIAIDTTALIEQKKGCNLHQEINGVNEITRLFERVYRNLSSPKLVILAPVRCESYYKAEKYDPSLLASVERGYADLLKHLEAKGLIDKVSVVVTPVQTVGSGVVFNRIDKDENGEPTFIFNKTGAKYNPKDSEQPLRYILRFVLSREVKGRWGIFNWLWTSLGKDKELKEAIDKFTSLCKIDDGFKVIQGHRLLDI